MNTFSIENQKRIQNMALQLRQKHDAMEWGIPIKTLIKKEGLDYEEYNLNEKSFLDKITSGMRKIKERIKAALIVKESAVLVDTDLHWAKKPFGQGHELGHHTIPEHKAILYVCSEHDLNPRTRLEMEFEANIFSSEVLFPNHLMEKIYEDYPLSIQTIKFLQQQSRASFHSTAIKYVNSAPHECCLLTFEVVSDEEQEGIKLLNQVWSVPWNNKYKKKLIEDGQVLSLNHNLAAILETGNDFHQTTVRLKNEDITFQAHTHYNSYNLFALLYT